MYIPASLVAPSQSFIHCNHCISVNSEIIPLLLINVSDLLVTIMYGPKLLGGCLITESTVFYMSYINTM